MKYTYFLLIALASCPAAWAKDPKQVNPEQELGWIDSDLDQEYIKPAPRVEFVQYQVQQPISGKSNSGYYAIAQAANLLEHVKANPSGTPPPFQSSHTNYFDHEGALWPSSILKFRIQTYFIDVLLCELAGGKRIPLNKLDNSIQRFSRLALDNACISFDTLPDDQWKSTDDFLAVIPAVVANLIDHTGEDFTFDREELRRVFSEQAKRLNLPGIDDAFDTVFPTLKTISLSASENPKLFDLKHLTPQDFSVIEYQLVNRQSELQKTFSLAAFRCFEYPAEADSNLDIVNTTQIYHFLEDLEKSLRKPILFISFAGSWMTCIAQKINGTIRLVALDPQNIDRRDEPEIQSLIQICEEYLMLTTQARSQKVKKPELTPESLKSISRPQKSDADEKSAKPNYVAPDASIPLDEFPSLEMFLGKVPNHILLVREQLKSQDTELDRELEFSNALLFEGPPGTGKTQLCQLLAREAGCLILYISGGAFRTAYQGSAKKLMDELINTALELIKTTGKRVVVLIDEVDGTTSRLEPHNSTQEDNRAIKVMISHLDQQRHNDKLYFMCTTNYPENMDSAILRRFERIEVPLPDYGARERIFRYYFKQRGIEIDTETPGSVSSEFLTLLLTATDGFSGDRIKKVVNNAVAYYKRGLPVEKDVSLLFRVNQFDFTNRSLASNLAHAASLPFIPVFHALDVYKYSPLEQHLYSQCQHQHDLSSTITLKEWEKDPANKHTKSYKLWLKSQLKTAGGAFWYGLCTALAGEVFRFGWNKSGFIKHTTPVS